MKILLERNNERFTLNWEFEMKFLSPVGKYVQWKVENNEWDDYNELFHAANFIHNLQKDEQVWFDTHCIEKESSIIGVLLMVGGAIKNLESGLVTDEKNTLLLKYFHIVNKGEGLGSFWLDMVIYPYYRAKGYKHIFVNSSHENSFRFYGKLGTLVRNYVRSSDNRLFEREGRSFLLSFG